MRQQRPSTVNTKTNSFYKMTLRALARAIGRMEVPPTKMEWTEVSHHRMRRRL